MKKIILNAEKWLALATLFYAKMATAQGGAETQKSILDNVRTAAQGFWNPIDTPEQGFGIVALFIGKLLNILLSLLGVIFLILIIYAGFRWMFSRGNEEEVAKAQKIMISSLQGLFIVVAAYAITNFVGYLLTQFNVLKSV